MVVGGNTSVGTITLSSKAVGAGALITLASSDQSATVSNLVIPAGHTSGTFKISTVAVASDVDAYITASYNSTTADATLTIKAPSLKLFLLKPSSVIGGTALQGILQITSPAPHSGLNIQLDASDPAVESPAQVVVASGTQMATFKIQTAPVNKTVTANVVATLGTSLLRSSVTVQPPSIFLTLAPAQVWGGGSSMGSVLLNGPAPAGGFQISLSSSDACASVPSTVTVPEATTAVSFLISTSPVPKSTLVNITAQAFNYVAATLQVNGQPPTPFSGNFKGSFLTDYPDVGGIEMNISNTGQIAGMTQSAISTGFNSISGFISKLGVATLILRNGSGSIQVVTLVFHGTNGQLSASFTSTKSGEHGYITMALTTNPFMYQGSFAGTFTASEGDSGSVSVTVSKLGAISGSGVSKQNGPFSITGTISTEGMVSVTTTSNGQSHTTKGGGAFDAKGNFVIIVVDGPNSYTTITVK